MSTYVSVHYLGIVHCNSAEMVQTQACNIQADQVCDMGYEIADPILWLGKAICTGIVL